MDDFGLRRQSGSGDGAFRWTEDLTDAEDFHACESGVALRLPPQSKTIRIPPGQLVTPKSDEGGQSLFLNSFWDGRLGQLAFSVAGRRDDNSPAF
jgi:hypothetical protein